ncbi:MAG: trypsin-like peptidase domain-containing protein [Oscillospiraceae bacterium]|nr:trypsin-like peptidase domain-containing protein [Oscillospiraceae bacterium]
MDEFEKNELNENLADGIEEQPQPEENSFNSQPERNTNAPSGWTYSANTNQYVSWDGTSDVNSTQWNPSGQNPGQQQPPRREYGTQYGYYGGEPHTNYYSTNGNYQWDFNKYESADRSEPVPKAKKSSGKGLRVFLGIILSLFCVCIISVSSIGIYRWLTGENRISDPVIEGSHFNNEEPETLPEEIIPPEIDLQDIPKENTFSTDGKLSATDVYKLVSPSVVGVVQYQYSVSLEPAGSGSGIILSDDGYIVTNAHVIDDAETVKIVLYNEEEYEAKIIGSDVQTDIAVLKIEANNLVEAEFGDSSQLEIGETVYALGNPGGLSLQSSFTDGMVSGLNRIINTESSYYMSVIQTSAAINPGNSGGALINEFGQVVGITSAKIISTDYEGIGFAIPTQTAKPIIEDIIKNGYVSGRAKIGITGVTIDSVTAKYYSVPEGVQIVTIDETGSLAGTEAKVGDIITAFGGKDVSSIEDIHRYLQNYAPGDEVEISLYRYSATRNNDLSFTITIKLVEDRGQ